MAYATYSNVQARFPYFTFGEATKPTSATVTEFIASAEGDINGALRALHYLSVPATDDSDVATLKDKVASYVAARCWFVAYKGTTPPSDVVQAMNDWRQFLADLKANNIVLNGQRPVERAGFGIASLIRREVETSEYTEDD
jgi:hypothetical protein